MKIKKETLQKALEIVKPGLASKEQLEQTTSFAFLKGRVVTYNDELSISHPIEGVELEGAIKAEEFYKILGKMKGEEIELEETKNEIILKSGRSSAGLTIEKEIKLPLTEEIGEKGSWHPIPNDFIRFVSLAIPSCGKNMDTPILTCVNVEKTGVIEGSDSHKLMHCELPEEMPVKSFLLPSSSANIIVRMNPIKISEGRGWVHFKTEEGTILSCRIYEAKFPDTSGILRTVEKSNLLVLPKSLSEALERAEVFSKRDKIADEIIKVTISENKIKINSQSEIGWFKEELNIKYDKDPIDFLINPYLLKDILKETQGCYFNKRTLLFEGEGWKYVTVLAVQTEK